MALNVGAFDGTMAWCTRLHMARECNIAYFGFGRVRSICCCTICPMVCRCRGVYCWSTAASCGAYWRTSHHFRPRQERLWQRVGTVPANERCRHTLECASVMESIPLGRIHEDGTSFCDGPFIACPTSCPRQRLLHDSTWLSCDRPWETYLNANPFQLLAGWAAMRDHGAS